MDTSKNADVEKAFDEMVAIADKYGVSGLIVVSHPNARRIRSQHLTAKIYMGDRDVVISIINDLGEIINKVYRLMSQNLYKIDITLQTFSKGDRDMFNSIYSAAEEELGSGADDILEGTQIATDETIKEAQKRGMDITDLPRTGTPRTVNKIRQLGNALLGNYFSGVASVPTVTTTADGTSIIQSGNITTSVKMNTPKKRTPKPKK